jgi:tRNA(adenine34) deaminase
MITIPEVSRETDEKFMREALRQARKAYALQEVPIGCVIVYEGQIIARGYNRRNTDRNTISHAEINAIRRASKKLGDWRLEGCTIYITLEPCQMCAGAIVQSRITRAVIGSMNPKAGCAGSVLNLLEMSEFNHQVLVERDVLREQCSDMLSGFFRELREIKKLQKEAARLQSEKNCNASAEKPARPHAETGTTILWENPQETVDE